MQNISLLQSCGSELNGVALYLISGPGHLTLQADTQHRALEQNTNTNTTSHMFLQQLCCREV
jgi:hypothetical protein